MPRFFAHGLDMQGKIIGMARKAKGPSCPEKQKKKKLQRPAQKRARAEREK
jgi:hypothetical protein